MSGGIVYANQANFVFVGIIGGHTPNNHPFEFWELLIGNYSWHY